MNRKPRGGDVKTDIVTLYADGASLPHRAGAGVVLLDRRGDIARLLNRSLPTMTNNEAEYAGLLLALELAQTVGAQFVDVKLDSEVVVFQMIGKAAVNSPTLKTWHSRVCLVALQFQRVRFAHIPRELNALADALAGEAAAGRSWKTSEG